MLRSIALKHGQKVLKSQAHRLAIQRRSQHTNVIDILRERHFVSAVTSDAIALHVGSRSTAVYCGVDPTAPSLHLGNMVTLMGLLHFHLGGHRAIPLVGNATGMIGDPSGRSTERVALDRATLARNVAGIEAQLQRFFSRGTEYALKRMPEIDPAGLRQVRVLHNADWYRDMNILAFLGSVGRYSRVGAMMARDSVKSRLQSVHGISFTEFSYQLLQAYDFWHLYHHHGCRIQLGGSDQWGNITAGTDLIHKMPFQQDGLDTGGIIADSEHESADAAYGLTIPLLTTSSGEKFGKSAGNAIWLDEAKTSPFDIYQFFVKTSDADVERFLKMFTLIPIRQITDVMSGHREAPENFAAQRLLAAEVTELIHGQSGLNRALCATEVLFGGKIEAIQKFSQQDFVDAFEGDQRMVSLARAEIEGKTIADIAVLIGSCKSKSEATRLARGGGLYWNNQPVSDSKWVPRIASADFVGQGTVGIVRTGKTNYRLVRVV
ncbi:tyrosyl-tRNA synthetase [Coemansia erecta]|uniref:Tyrosine--tRNA ligase n=1 Tax=Coemansia erecta TaxID=147472 RepID=A0A9W7Y508_9FUNG|nr:tyrosyl-tRNA synthetase [Coemansia erecta]